MPSRMSNDAILEDEVLETIFANKDDFTTRVDDSQESTIDTTMLPVATSLPCMTVTGAIGC